MTAAGLPSGAGAAPEPPGARRIVRYLLPVIGKRSFLGFGIATFLVGALLSAVNVTSRHALARYVDDQLARTPWDLAVYDQSGGSNAALASSLGSMQAVERVEQLVFLRAGFSSDVSVLVDGQPLATPWLCVLSASSTELLPPELRNLLSDAASRGPGGEPGAVLALIGSESAMGDAFASLQGASDFRLQARSGGSDNLLFSTVLDGVIRLDADELNRWFMDQTGSITMIPAVSAVLLTPYREEVIDGFDLAATGRLPVAGGGVPLGNPEYLPGEYLPEIAYLAKLDRARLISGWDLDGSLERFTGVRDDALEIVSGVEIGVFVDSTVLVLLERMAGISRLLGLLTLLIALPVLCMAWVFQANLARLLMLNERRMLGLLRLRGVPGQILGRALLVSIVSGGFLGGSLGLILGALLPLLVYSRGWPPAEALDREQVYLSLLFLAVTLGMVLAVGRRLVRYATTISPLEASRRVSIADVSRAGVRFGPLELLSVLLGAYTLGSWITGLSLSSQWPTRAAWIADRGLDFIGLPLFVYGVACLVVSRGAWIQRLLEPLVLPLGGRLGPLALRHASRQPHRTVVFLLTVVLMASVSLYPTVTSASFRDKVVRGAETRTGGDWLLTFNAPDLVAAEASTPDLRTQLAAMGEGVERLSAALEGVPGVISVASMAEAVLQDLYLPGYGLRGVPLHLIDGVERYLQTVHVESALGTGAPLETILRGLDAGELAASPSVSEFWELTQGSQLAVGTTPEFETIAAPVSGTVAFLPGMPTRSVTDREGYVQARIDYLNTLFSQNAYVVSAGDNEALSRMHTLIPRVTVLVSSSSRSPGFGEELLRALPIAPLEIRSADEEIERVAGDMFISLAQANMSLYLLGGVLLAVMSIIAIALVNYREDRRMLALVRIRGASPAHIRRLVVALILSPALLGLVLGAIVAVLAGYGLANHVWSLRGIETVVQLLPTHVVLSPLALGVTLLVLAVLVGLAAAFSQWVFRRTARENALTG